MAQALKTPASLHDRILIQRIEERRFAARPHHPDRPRRSPRRQVLAVGKGTVSEDGKKTPLDVKAAIACCSASTREASHPERRRVPDHEGGRRLGILAPRLTVPAGDRLHRLERKISMPKQLLFKEEARAALLRGVNVIAHRQGHPGAEGRNVVLDKKYGSPTITKDGVAVAKEIELKDPYENMGPR